MYDLLTACLSLPIGLRCSNVAVFPDLSSYFGEYYVRIADRNGSQNYKNKIQILINQDYPLKC